LFNQCFAVVYVFFIENILLKILRELILSEDSFEIIFNYFKMSLQDSLITDGGAINSYSSFDGEKNLILCGLAKKEFD